MPSDLRRRAEEAVRSHPLSSPEARAGLSPEDVLRLLHELTVQQVELEMQNEGLRRAETELEASLARYVELYDSSPVGYCTLVDGVVSEANPAAASLLGLSQDILIGQPLIHFIQEEDKEIYYQCRKWFFETGESQDCELRMLKGDKTVFWAHLSTMERRAPSRRQEPGAGQAAVSSLVLSDITARRREEEQKAKLEGMLRQAQKLKTLGELAGGMAHDFNNLLATIVGNANLASMVVEPDSQVSSFMTAIENAAMRAAKLTRQMLAYSGQGKYHQAEVDINLVLNDSLHFIQNPMAPGVNIHAVLSDRLPFVQGDPIQISEVIVDLLTNALEAMEPGQDGLLTVRTSAESLSQADLESGHWALPIHVPGPFATLEVTDQGTGMDPHIMDRLFEPFFSTKFTGRGLGLPEVMGVVRSHGGGIRVQSEPGKGSTFKIFLPALRTSRSQSSREFLPVWRGVGRILVVDDEEEELNRVRRMAEQLGFTIIEATDGPQAVEIFRLRHGDLALVLLDLSLPQVSIRAALHELKEIDGTIPVVLGSPYQVKELDAFMETQAGCLRKPYRMAEFQGLLQRTLELRHAAGS